MAGTAVSVTANAVHATVASDADVPGLLASCVAAVPPLVLLASTHLTVVLVRSRRSVPGLTAEAVENREDAEGIEDDDASEMASVPGVGGRREFAAGLRAEGWSNKAIARRLGVAPSTIGRWFSQSGTVNAPHGFDKPMELAR
jgi:DNA-binding NarL/FixJ family response regulator